MDGLTDNTQPTSQRVYAHSLSGSSESAWEPLSHHLAAVAQKSGKFAASFGWQRLAGLAGRLHDIGKCSALFQAYIRGRSKTGGDHSSAGAQVARERFPGPSGRMLSFAIAGHHAGLSDGRDLDERLGSRQLDAPGWEEYTGSLPAARTLAGPFLPAPDAGFGAAFLIRMVFSCLIDADFLETERFYAEAGNQPIERGNHRELTALRDRLRQYMVGMRATADDGKTSALNTLRGEVLDHAIAKAALPPGAFTLTVPTGGGKTLTSLSFALEHAVRHGLRRVVYVIPFTSIIEQTAAVFREALSTEEDILEHHASFDWDRGPPGAGDDEGRDGLAKLRRAAENWDVPIVVTTAVQFFESLYAARPSRCRKLHNLAGSVIVLDEAQLLPLRLLRPCVAALRELTTNYRTSVVLCTATQPALREKDGFRNGFAIDDDRELAPQPRQLYARLKRVTVEHLPGRTDDATIAERFAEQRQGQMLCIVNSRAHASALFQVIRPLPGAVHLSTLMCPLHRRAVLAEVRQRLKHEQPARVVSTSLIEAGVDISFPEVWRAITGLDSIAQAAGRCNREGELPLGRTVVFEPAEAKSPVELTGMWQAARAILRRHPDPLTLDAISAYFKELYWQRGADAALDAVRIDGRPGILAAIAERARKLDFPFAAIAAEFRIIDNPMEPVIVPWRRTLEDYEADKLLARIAAMERPHSRDLRRLQQYTVPIPPRTRAAWLAAGVLRPVHEALGEALLRFENLAHYDEATGVRLDDPTARSVELNVIS